jgi:hypothetical protein
MPSGEDGEQKAVDNMVLTDDDFADLVAQQVVFID